MNVYLTAKLQNISTNAKFRFSLDEVTRAKNIIKA